jgi:hypothetical protein
MHTKFKFQKGPGCRTRQRWTAEIDRIAREMRSTGSTYAQIAEVINLSQQTVGRRLFGVPYAATYERGKLHLVSDQCIRPSDRAMIDREIREAAISERREQMLMRGYVSFLIGDIPPPGRSALDRKRAGT